MTHKLECYTAQPTPGFTGQNQPLPEDTAILLGTPVGSRIDVTGEILGGDTGVRAQALANEFGAKVVAWQDLGPKVRFPGLLTARRKLTVDNFPEYASECADTIADALQAQEINRVVMRVHSGVGPLGTELAKALHAPEHVTVSHLAISDPVGLRQVTFLQGWRLTRTYGNGAAKQTPLEHRNDPGHPPNTFYSFLSDVAVRGTTVWLTDITYRNLVHIGTDQQDTAVLLHLPGNTLNGSPTEIQALAADIQDKARRPDNTFVVAFEPAHYHSSEYDSLTRNAAFIRRAIALAPLTEGPDS